MSNKNFGKLTPEELREVQVPAPGELPLTNKRFVLNYLSNGGNVTQAAKAAGISPRHGYRLLANKKVKEFLNEMNDSLLRDEICSAAETMFLLSAIARGEDTDVFVNQKGEKIVHEVNSLSRLKALDMLSRYWGILEQKETVKQDFIITVLPHAEVEDDYNEQQERDEEDDKITFLLEDGHEE